MQKIKRKHGKINVIPNNSDRYISFDVGRLTFLDSMQFLSCGLDKLAEQLSNDQFKYLKAAYPEHCKLLSKKVIYCYDYMNNKERFDETSLPQKGQYEYAEDVWKTLECNTMKDYHHHYLITDIILLADVFDNFRKMSLETYGLDPIHYYSSPGLSWDAMIKYTDVDLELITDPGMHQMVENGMRGSISKFLSSVRYLE